MGYYWGPHNLLFSGHCGQSSRPTFSAKVKKKRVDIFLHSHICLNFVHRGYLCSLAIIFTTTLRIRL